MRFTYIFNSTTYKNTDESEMTSMGISNDNIKAVRLQESFDKSNFNKSIADASYTKNQLIQQHCVEPTVSTTELNGTIYYNNDGVRTPIRGGGWHDSPGAGLAALYLSYARSSADYIIGFRPAYFE